MKYIAKLVTQMSFWYGLAVILFTLFGGTRELLALGLVMLFLHDSYIAELVSKIAPGLTKWVQEIVDGL